MRLRTFIAVELPAELRRAILIHTASLQKELAKPMVRWVELNNLHLTLKFLGDVSPDALDRLAESLKGELYNHPPFNLRLAGLGTFPNPHQPRILWVGLEAPGELSRLQHSVELVTTQMGFPAEDRPFAPHLTIGRVGQTVGPADRVKIGLAVGKISPGTIGLMHVENLSIFKSDLRPGGPLYTRLYSLPFRPA